MNRPDAARFRAEFEDGAGAIWLNTAHQGRLPRRAATALDAAVRWKQHPEMLATSARFSSVPARLRAALARMLAADEDDVILTNSASYGLHMIAAGLDLRAGDEVIVAATDFPSDILPWLLMRDRGAVVRMIEPRAEVPTAAEVEEAITDRTRAVCTTWVHSFSGRVADLDAIGALCRRHGVWFVVNASQGVGVRPLAPTQVPVDAVVSVGWKWLCGPYGTGVCYLRPALHDALRPAKLYWLNALTVEALAAPRIDLDAVTPPRRGGRDVFATANFFNFVPFTAAVELMLELGTDRAARYVDGLVLRLLDGLDRARYRLVSSAETRSSLVVFEPATSSSAAVVGRLANAGIHVAHRRGRIRVAPHVYNTADEIDRLLDEL